MTADNFRKMALEYPDAIESAHMNHPDFRINGRIFATLGVPDEGSAMVKLTPEQQQAFMRESPRVFYPCSGAWGRGGATHVRLASANRDVVRAALDCAFQNVAAKTKKQKQKKKNDGANESL